MGTVALETGREIDICLDADLETHGIAGEINAHVERLKQGTRTQLELARKIGDLLNEAKKRVSFGQWGDWITQNLDISARTVESYMKISSGWQRIQATIESN